MKSCLRKISLYLQQNYHVLIFSAYFLLVLIVSLFLKYPAVNLASFLIAGLLPVGTLLTISVVLSSKKIALNTSPGGSKKLNLFFNWYDKLVFVLFLICFCSIGYAALRNFHLFDYAFSYSLRLITTTFHSLIPLETRLFHTLAPFSILAPFGNKKIKRINFLLLILMVALMQVKVAPLYLILIGSFYIIQGTESFISWKYISFIGVSLLIFFPTLNVISGYKNLYDNSVLSSGNSDNWAPSERLKNCKHQADLETDELMQKIYMNSYLINRAIVIPAKISRLHVCAWDNGFHGLFKGHQIAKLFGQFEPVYNRLYRLFFPDDDKNFSATAVGNLIYDSYFQLGWPGSLLATLILSTLVLLIKLFDNTTWGQLGNLLKINFIYGSLTSSLISTALFFLPAIFLCAFYASRVYLHPPCLDEFSK